LERPKSIVLFSRCYLAALALQVLGAIVNWRTATPGAIQIGLIVALLLWYGVVYQRSKVSRILLLILYPVGLLTGIIGFLAFRPDALVVAGMIAPLILYGIAFAMLIEKKASDWFDAKVA
jgi:hypothetical protein